MKRYECLATLLFFCGLLATACAAATEKVLYGFTGGTDGGLPSSPLIMDGAGNLYGTTWYGGNAAACPELFPAGCGVVFEVSPLNGGWQQSVIYTFQGGADGAVPGGSLLFDSAGNLYGTTAQGGTGCEAPFGCGTVYELSPNPDGTWTKTVLYNFQAAPTDGNGPVGLTRDASGNLYGVTPIGGANYTGAIFELSPPAKKDGSWVEKVIYNLRNDEIALNPGVVFDHDGNLYATYYHQYACYGGCGAIVQLQPVGGSWKGTDIVDFPGGGNGGEPLAPVIVDDQGNLYGTGSKGGNNFGTVFELLANGGHWKGSMLYSFCSRNHCIDGITPTAGLVRDDSGVLYGTTSGGELQDGQSVVFKLTHTKYGWEEIVLHHFQGGSDGFNPQQSMILDGQGNLYGTTTPEPIGNNPGFGTVFEVTP